MFQGEWVACCTWSCYGPCGLAYPQRKVSIQFWKWNLKDIVGIILKFARSSSLFFNHNFKVSITSYTNHEIEFVSRPTNLINVELCPSVDMCWLYIHIVQLSDLNHFCLNNMYDAVNVYEMDMWQPGEVLLSEWAEYMHVHPNLARLLSILMSTQF